MAVILVAMEPNVINVVMMGFLDKLSPMEDPGANWKHWLLHRLNQGIVY